MSAHIMTKVEKMERPTHHAQALVPPQEQPMAALTTPMSTMIGGPMAKLVTPMSTLFIPMAHTFIPLTVADPDLVIHLTFADDYSNMLNEMFLAAMLVAFLLCMWSASLHQSQQLRAERVKDGLKTEEKAKEHERMRDLSSRAHDRWVATEQLVVQKIQADTMRMNRMKRYMQSAV